MRVNKNHTIEEIKALYKDAEPKFVSLKTSTGEFVLHYNRPKEQDAKFKLICEKLLKRSTTPGVYVVSFRASTLPTAQEQEYPISVGNVPVESANPVAYSVQYPAESVWSMQKAMEVLQQKMQLEMQLNFANMEIERLQEVIEEIEEELEQAKKSSPLSENRNNPLSFFEDAKTTIKPILDIYFEQKDRELTLAEKAAGIGERKKVNGNSAKERTDQGVLPSDKEYVKYFENILNHGTQEQLDYECDYLQAHWPDIYPDTMKFYGIVEDTTEETEEAETEEDKTS